MRVALICDWYAPRRGGIEAHLSALAERLATAGHEVHVITSTPGPATAAEKLTVHRLPGPLVPLAGVAYTRSSVKAIGAILRREKIDVAHTHISIVAPVGIAGATQAQKAGIPTVVTFHSFVPGTRVWARAAGQLVRAGRWKAVMTAVSSRVVQEVETFSSEHTFSVLPNAIDRSFWTPAEVRPETDVLSVVYAGRLQSKKRPQLAIETAAALRERVPRLSFRLRMVGVGPLERALRSMVEARGLGDCVDFPGWKNARDMRDIFRQADIFLSPSRRESFGLAALEARAVGVPVVGMRASAVPDFIENDLSGIVVDRDGEFVDAVVRLAVDDVLRARIASHNRTVTAPYHWERAMAMHLQAYEDARALMNQPRRVRN